VQSSPITITPVDGYGTVINTITNSITITLANGNTQSNINNGITNTIADGNGGETTETVYPDPGEQLFTYTDGNVSVGYNGFTQTVTYNYIADGNGGYTEEAVYPAFATLLGIYSFDTNYSIYITEVFETKFFNVNVIANGSGGYTLEPQYPSVGADIRGSTEVVISLPYSLTYTYQRTYLSDGNGGYTLGGHPTSLDKIGLALNAGSITSPSGTLVFNISYWGDGNGGYTALNEVVAGTTIGEDQDYIYVVNGSLDSYDAIPKA
jgi:hypothetical protein